MCVINPSHVKDQTDELLDNSRPDYQETARIVLDNATTLSHRVSGRRPASND